jgi:hypothetical protein
MTETHAGGYNHKYTTNHKFSDGAGPHRVDATTGPREEQATGKRPTPVNAGPRKTGYR